MMRELRRSWINSGRQFPAAATARHRHQGKWANIIIAEYSMPAH